MTYKHAKVAEDSEERRLMLDSTQVNLKLIPGVTGEPEIAQLVAYNLTELKMKGFWNGPVLFGSAPWTKFHVSF